MSEQKQLVNVLRPTKIDEFVGNKSIMYLVKRNLEKGSFPHLVIFTGANGVGKSSLAEYVAMSLACKNRNGVDPCGVCDACRQAKESQMQGGAVKKIDMASLCSKKDVLEILKDIFVFEGGSDKNIHILEEFQSLPQSGSDTFLEYLTKVPEDVYIFATTHDINAIAPSIRNRFTELALERPSFSEAVEFATKCMKDVGVACSSKEVIKDFVRGCKSNPRRIVTNLELFAPLSAMDASSVKAIFKVDTEATEHLWEMLFDKSVLLETFAQAILEASESESAMVLCSNIHMYSLTCLVESKAPMENSELSTVKKGAHNALIKQCGNYYKNILEVFKTTPATDEEALNLLIRAKMTNQVLRNDEQANVSIAKTTSVRGSSYFDKYPK